MFRGHRCNLDVMMAPFCLNLRFSSMIILFCLMFEMIFCVNSENSNLIERLKVPPRFGKRQSTSKLSTSSTLSSSQQAPSSASIDFPFQTQEVIDSANLEDKADLDSINSLMIFKNDGEKQREFHSIESVHAKPFGISSLSSPSSISLLISKPERSNQIDSSSRMVYCSKMFQNDPKYSLMNCFLPKSN